MIDTKARLPQLDILRVIAALWVLLYHFTFREPLVDSIPTQGFPYLDVFTRYGFLGVQLFFIVSGFVILMSAEQGSAKKFAINRARRIYPTFWICCTLTFALTLMWGAPLFQFTWYQYFINTTLLTDFFREYAIDGAYWSIFVEIKFYLFIFLILALKGIKKIEWIYFGWIALIGLFILLPGNQKPTLEFLLSHYMPYFAMGSIFYLWWQGRMTRISYLTFAFAYAIAIYNSFYEIDTLNRNLKGDYYSKWIYNIAITLFLLAIYLIVSGRLKMHSSRLITKLGLLTYPLYLVHQHVGIMIMKELPANIPNWGSVGIASVSVISLAWVVLISEKWITTNVSGFLAKRNMERIDTAQ